MTETKDENGNVVRAIDADVLHQEISATVVEGPQERYQFTWPDKKKSVVLAISLLQKRCSLDRKSQSAKAALQEILIQKISISRAIIWTH